MNILFFLKPKNDIAYINDNFTLRQALEKMKHYGYAAIPIIDAEGKYAGTLSEGDLLWAILGRRAYEHSEQEQICVMDILLGRLYAPVNVNASIEDLLLMAMNQNFVPVTDDRGLFIGIVTRRDIMQHYYDETYRLIADAVNGRKG
jgi:CBS domain-containing protein